MIVKMEVVDWNEETIDCAKAGALRGKKPEKNSVVSIELWSSTCMVMVKLSGMLHRSADYHEARLQCRTGNLRSFSTSPRPALMSGERYLVKSRWYMVFVRSRIILRGKRS